MDFDTVHIKAIVTEIRDTGYRMSIFSHIEFQHHEQVAFCHDKKTGLKAIIAVHNTHRGPALGGCRMWPYNSDEEALHDALRLSKGMTYKSALAGLPLGGGKAVIIGDPRKDKTPGLLHAMGEFVEKLSGRYITAEDSGTSVADMITISEKTQYAAGIVTDGNHSHSGDPSPSTALGTFYGVKAAVKHRLKQEDLTGLKVAIQGVGNVGYHLGKHLKEAGAELIVTDIFEANWQRAVNELGATYVEPDQIYSQDVDVFSPCALGAIINDNSLTQLKASIIAGASNNQLATPEHGDQLHKKGILYAPDYVINAGGIIDVAHQCSGKDPQETQQHIARIADTLSEIFDRSKTQDISTHLVADKMAEELFQ